MVKIHDLIGYLKEIRKVDDLEIILYALDSLIEKLEESKDDDKDPIEKKDF